MSKGQLVVIGDIHSRFKALEQALKNIEPSSVIFLGDVLDGRHYPKGTCESVKTHSDLATLKIVCDYLNLGAKLIAGNHDIKLIFGTETVKGYSAKTKARLASYEIYTSFIKQIKQAETYLQIESGDKVYHLAHAVPFASATKTVQVFGEKVEGQRVKWYKSGVNSWPDNVVKVCGHYHKIIVGPNLVILDGDNKTDECLPVLVIENGTHRLWTYKEEFLN